MKKINEIFFAKEGEKGITSSSANYLANIATELLESIKQKLDRTSFINEEIAIIGRQERATSKLGFDAKAFAEIPTSIKVASQLNAFIAYIREAIKAKDDEVSTAKRLTFEEWLEQNNLSLEDYPDKPKEPELPAIVTQEDILSEWSIAERNRYFEVEATASTYGKLIHKDGILNNARDTMKFHLASPVETSGNGRDTIIYYYSASIPEEQVDDLFLKLQNEYRANEKELNGMKYKIKEQMHQLTVEREMAYKEALEQHRRELQDYNAKVDEINNKTSSLTAKYREDLSTLVNNTSKLKIVIPNSLLEIFHYLDGLGK